MDNLIDKTVGSIVADNLQASKVFDKYGIDYCCKGDRILKAVCDLQQLDANQVIDEISKAVELPSKAGHYYNDWPIDLLADYIEKIHHRYVLSSIPEIVKKLEKINEVHGKVHPELAQVLSLFKDSAIALTNHMKKEENVLFPYIRKMVNEGKASSDEIPPFGSFSNPIIQMMAEHDTEGERFRKITELTHNFVVPDDGCNSYRLAMEMLKNFNDDLHVHIHLENNILFPKALRLEKSNA